MSRSIPARPTGALALLAGASITFFTPAGVVLADDSAADFIPSRVPLAITIRSGDEQLASLRTLMQERGFFESPAFAAVKANPGLAATRVWLMGIAAAAGTDAWSAVGSVLGRETTIAVAPGPNGQPAYVAVSIARDPAALDRFLDEMNVASGLIVNGKPNALRSRDVDGVRVFALTEEFFHGRKGPALIMSNSRELMLDALRAGDSTLARREEFRSTAARVPDGAEAWLFADVAALRTIDGLGALLAEKAENPLAGYLLGGWSHALAQASEAGVWIDARGDALAIDLDARMSSDWPAERRAFLNGPATISAWRAADLPGYLAELRLQRDWTALFSDREALLALPAASQAANFATTMSTLLGQIDFLDDFLPRVTGPARLVLTRQDFAARAHQPTPKLPAFALVVPMDFASDPLLAEQLHSSAISTLSIIGFDQAQKDQPALMTKLGVHRDIQYVYGAYPTPRDAEGGIMTPGEAPSPVAVQFNFAPAIGVVGDSLVIATSPESLEAVIDARLDAGTKTVATGHDELVIDSAGLAAILRDNHEELVMNRMLQKNETREQAEATVESILAAIAYAGSLQLTSQAADDGLKVHVELTLAEPPMDADRR